jgi:hypothetical protein
MKGGIYMGYFKTAFILAIGWYVGTETIKGFDSALGKRLVRSDWYKKVKAILDTQSKGES